MNQEEKQLSDAQLAAELLKNIKPHSSYEPIEGMPIPYSNGILVKHMPKASIISNLIDLEGGGKQELYEATANNTQDTCEGIIMSVGPTCSPVVRRGLKIQYTTNVKSTAPVFRHKGKDYLGMDEYSILFFMVDESTTVDLGTKDARQVRREKKIPQQQKIYQKMHEKEMNDKDKSKDKTKGKVKPVSTKYK